jgi:hypothetical protein
VVAHADEKKRGKSLEFLTICCREFVQLAPMADKSRSAAFGKSFINKLLTVDVNLFQAS